MAKRDSSVLTVSIDALQTTKDAAGWLIAMAETSKHPDAEAAARWLDAMGERTYRLLADLAVDAAKVVDDPLSKVTASAKILHTCKALPKIGKPYSVGTKPPTANGDGRFGV